MRRIVRSGRSERRQRGTMYFFRYVPRTSTVHRLWAGTKLVCVLAIAATLTLIPSWASIGLFAALVLVVMILAQVPHTVPSFRHDLISVIKCFLYGLATRHFSWYLS